MPSSARQVGARSIVLARLVLDPGRECRIADRQRRPRDLRVRFGRVEHAALEAVGPVVVAVVAEDDDRRVVEQPLALERRQHLADRVVGHAAGAPDLVREAAGERRQRQAVLDVRDRGPRRRSRTARASVSSSKRSNSVGKSLVPHTGGRSSGQDAKRVVAVGVEAVEADEARVVAAVLEDRKQVARCSAPGRMPSNSDAGVELEIVAVEEVGDRPSASVNLDLPQLRKSAVRE